MSTAGPPRAVVEQTGRLTYLVYIEHGPMRYGPEGHGWTRVTRRAAQRKALRELSRYRRRASYGKETIT